VSQFTECGDRPGRLLDRPPTPRRGKHMKIIGILVAITCLPMDDAAQAACRTLADAYQLQRDARVLDTTPEQLEIMLNAGLLARAAAGDQTAAEELVCRGWSQSQIDAAVRRKGHPATQYPEQKEW
jgi:hypothetical protein